MFPLATLSEDILPASPSDNRRAEDLGEEIEVDFDKRDPMIRSGCKNPAFCLLCTADDFLRNLVNGFKRAGRGGCEY